MYVQHKEMTAIMDSEGALALAVLALQKVPPTSHNYKNGELGTKCTSGSLTPKGYRLEMKMDGVAPVVSQKEYQKNPMCASKPPTMCTPDVINNKKHVVVGRELRSLWPSSVP